MAKASDEFPVSLYSFNGHTQALTNIWTNMMTTQGDKARIFFVVGGPNVGSNFHIIGQIFDKVYKGDPNIFDKNEETVLVPPGSAAVFELSTLVPGEYLLVDHALWRAPKGALGFLHVEYSFAPTPENPAGSWPFDIYFPQALGTGH